MTTSHHDRCRPYPVRPPGLAEQSVKKPVFVLCFFSNLLLNLFTVSLLISSLSSMFHLSTTGAEKKISILWDPSNNARVCDGLQQTDTTLTSMCLFFVASDTKTLPCEAWPGTAVKKWKMEVDEALGKLGKIGRWQIFHFAMIGASCSVLPCFHMLAIIYIGKCSHP